MIEPASKKLTVKEKEILDSIEESVHQVKLHREGKIKLKTMQQLLDELKIHYTDVFAKELKHLAKKYPSIKPDLAPVIDQLQRTPKMGTPLGNDC